MSHYRTRHAAPVLALLTFGAGAHAATWAGGRATPTLREIIAVDASGESRWPYGQEDVAGDGVGTFKPPEQSIDIRTAYAATDDQRFWARVYVSDTQPPGGYVRAFVFVDADSSAATGGTAVAPEIDAKFSSDASPGGYEFVVEVGGTGTAVQLWTWQRNRYGTSPLPAMQAAGEAGTDVDPIRIGEPTHGYLQASVDLGDVGLTRACDANLYVRTVNDTAALGEGDLEVGSVSRCIAAVSGNGVPAVLEPPGGCTSDGDCPGGGLCQAGRCVIAASCVTNADCGAGMQCTTDGRCVAEPTGPCATIADCNDLVCQGGQCVACTPGGTPECATGQVCAPDGRCILDQGAAGGAPGVASGDGGLALAPGESVKGGACHCTLAAGARSAHAPFLLAASLGLLLLRRRPRGAR